MSDFFSTHSQASQGSARRLSRQELYEKSLNEPFKYSGFGIFFAGLAALLLVFGIVSAPKNYVLSMTLLLLFAVLWFAKVWRDLGSYREDNPGVFLKPYGFIFKQWFANVVSIVCFLAFVYSTSFVESDVNPFRFWNFFFG